MADLFDVKLAHDLDRTAPLADRLRPVSFDEFFGQERAVGPGTILRHAIENDELFSIIFWGPPGSGKTTVARIIARLTESAFVQLSAVSSGKADLTRIVREAEERRKFHGQRTVLFID
ncbi:MAG: AAA family ATPase, partial [Candidatus Kerfeldbacteria bacterium]|nr:AAA family ATPase [Candidatus Kerfeldbacteria bacterium]